MRMKQFNRIQKELRVVASKQRAEISQRFFKTGPGEYGEGDVFIGVTMPQQRFIAKRHLDLAIAETQLLLDSEVHEERMMGLLILTYQYPKATTAGKKDIYDFYIANTGRVNNWDLVDVTAPKIVGAYLLENNRQILVRLAKSNLLWDKRIAIISTQAFIAHRESEWTFKIALMLLEDTEDLIHKATGWTLREVGKKCGEEVEKEFLDEYVNRMPRTMLRYAIERFPEQQRQEYLSR